MKKVLILGINGTFGKHVAKALQQHGWHVLAMLRDTTKIPAGFKQLEIIEGDAANIVDVRHAASDASMIVYGVNPANYDWEGKAIEWLDITATVAEEKKCLLVFPGNVYNFDPGQQSEFNEASGQSPVSRKGEIRQQMEQRLQHAADNGADVLIFRMGDFIAAGSRSSWLQHIVQDKKDEVILRAPGPEDIRHSWAYLPDVASSIAMLTDDTESLRGFNVFHFQGYRASINEMAESIRGITDKKVSVKSFPWWTLYPVRPFLTVVKGLFEMRYLWNTELNLDDAKLQQALNNKVPRTSLGQALKHSFNF